MRRRLAIVPLGRMRGDPGLPAWLGRELARTTDADVVQGPEIDLHDRWAASGSDRLDSNLVIDALVEALAPDAGDPALPDFDWTLAVTEADLCAPGRPFVFGEATLGGPCAVISLARLQSDDLDVLRRRALKEAAHEIGHLAGLDHCTDPRCVMFPSTDLAQTDVKHSHPCDRCGPSYPLVRGD